MNAKGLCRLATMTAAAMSSTNATLAETLYYEDFASGNAARGVWRESPSAAFFDASSGDYVLTQPDGDTPVYSFVTGIPEVAHLTDTLTGSSRFFGRVVTDSMNREAGHA